MAAEHHKELEAVGECLITRKTNSRCVAPHQLASFFFLIDGKVRGTITQVFTFYITFNCTISLAGVFTF